jgi:hypothetical protein
MTEPIRVEPLKATAPNPVIRAAAATNRADRQFSIKRTKSEVGYVYWILEGFGKHKCFVLCDTWEEAMEQAKARLDSDKEDSQEFLFADGL